MIANLTKHPLELLAGQTVAHCYEHPTAPAESYVSHAELLGVVNQETKYRKRDYNVKGTNHINEHLEDARNASVHQSADHAMTADDVELHVDKKYHPKIRAMFRKHQGILEGRLG